MLLNLSLVLLSFCMDIVLGKQKNIFHFDFKTTFFAFGHSTSINNAGQNVFLVYNFFKSPHPQTEQ